MHLLLLVAILFYILVNQVAAISENSNSDNPIEHILLEAINDNNEAFFGQNNDDYFGVEVGAAAAAPRPPGVATAEKLKRAAKLAHHTRLKVNISPNSTPNIERIATTLLRDYVSGNQWPLSNFTEFILSMTDLYVKNVTFKGNLAVSFVDNMGIRLELSGFDLVLTYNASLTVDRSFVLYNEALITNSKLSAVVNVTQNATEGGKAALRVAAASVAAGHIDPFSLPIPHNKKWSSYIARIVERLLNDTFQGELRAWMNEDEGPTLVTQLLRLEANTYVNTLNQTIDLDGLGTLMNITLAAQPTITRKEGLDLAINGDIYDAGAAAGDCMLPVPARFPPPPPRSSPAARDVTFTVSQSVFGCLLASEQASGHIENILRGFLHRLNMDKKLNLTLDLPLAPSDLEFSQSKGITVKVSVYVGVARIWNLPALGLHIDLNSTADGVASFDAAGNLSVALSSVVSAFDVPLSGLSANFPPRFVAQINRTDFARLDKKLNKAIAAVLQGDINPKLRNVWQLPAIARDYLGDLELVYYDDFVQLGADFGRLGRVK